jgi:hypothetical protein
MQSLRKLHRHVVVLAFGVALLTPVRLAAQGVTTGQVEGTINSAKSPVGDVTVVAVHLESGTRYVGRTRSDGRYSISGLRVGGPYFVTAQRIGFQKAQRGEIYITLGQTTPVDFDMSASAVQLQGVEITSTKDAILNSERSGAATTITRQALENLPTISRRLDNIVRLSPLSGGGLSFVGQDSRFNNITVDGSYFNNSFGLGNTPGDRTGVAPISLDAIEQVQVNVAPFDVREGNFVGANVNTVTRSGTNLFRGSIGYNGRNQSMVGTRAGANAFNPGTNTYHNGGGWLSGPLLKDRAFFFVNYETDALNQPATSFVANTGGQTVQGNTTRVLASDLDALSSYLKTNFGYNTGVYQNYNSQTPSTRYLGKIDVNLNDRNKFSLRYNRLDSFTDVLLSNSSSLGFGTRRSNNTGLNFQNSNYQILENIRSTVGELNSSIGSGAANALIVGYTHQDESRASRAGSIANASSWFPFVDILNGGTVYTSFGFEPFTPNNELRYNTAQIQDNLTFLLRNHTLTFGLSGERYHSENVFYPGAQSVYTYNTLADFYADAADYLAKCGGNPTSATCLNRQSAVTLRRFQVRYMNVPGLSKPVQPLSVTYAGAYAQDEWTPVENFRLMAGIRVDAPWWANTAYDNSQADALSFRDADGSTVHYNSGALPKTNALFSPRVGFNWDVHGNRTTQLRGGTGVFTGKPAYVWISNQIGNTGILTGFTQVDNTKAFPFNPDPNAYKPSTPPTGAPAASYELDVTDRNFKFPQTWRTDVGADQQLPWGFIGTGEVLYNRDINGIYYINANLPAAQSSFTGVDNRPRWTSNRINQNITSAIVLKNESQGYQWTVSGALERSFAEGIFAKFGYSYTVAKNTVDAGSTAAASWTGNQVSIDPNNPGVGYSGNSPGQRYFFATSISRNPLKIGRSTLSLFSELHTGGNFGYTFAGDANGDASTNNDLIYIPRDTSQMNFKAYSQTVGSTTFNYSVDQQKQAWEKFIEQDAYLSSHRGQYAQRNAAFLPMVFRTDLSFSQHISSNIPRVDDGFELRIDILNVGNLLNKNWGIGKNLVTTQPLVISGNAADANGKLVYQLRNIAGQLIDHTYDASAGLSDVYRFQLSLRYNF